MASPDPDISFNVPSPPDDDAESVHSFCSVDPDADQCSPAGDTRIVNVVQSAPPPTSHDRTNNNPVSSAYYSHVQPSPSNNCGDYQQQRPTTFSVPVQHSFMKPDTYDGSTAFEQYMSHFEDCAELSNWDDRTRVLVLASCLRGPARNFYISLSVAERRDYYDLRRRLRERFGSSKHQNLWLAKFEGRRRLRGEAIASIADDLRQLSQKAYADLDHVAQESLALNQLYKQVSGEMQCRCIDNNCKTINDAVEVIERYEAVLGTSQAMTVRSVDVSTTDSQVLSAVKRPETRLDRLEKACLPVPQRNQVKPKVCYGCQSPNHIWRNCPQNRNGTAHPSEQFRPADDSGAQQSLRPARQPFVPACLDRATPALQPLLSEN